MDAAARWQACLRNALVLTLLLSHACVHRETLRRDPVVGAVMRVSTREFALGDYQVPASQTFLVPLRDLAEHDPRWEGKTGVCMVGAASLPACRGTC